jgi:RNA polymerase sigma factor (sigma-70 family)
MNETVSHEQDRELVQSVLGGRPGVFERLVREYQGLCWHILLRMVRNPDDARELCQETFLRVHQCLHQYRGDSALKSWIGQVAYSIGKRYLERRRIPLVEGTDDEDGLSAAESVSDGFDLVAAHGDQEVARHLHDSIAKLPAAQRTILTLYHLEEMSISEISDVTGIAEGTIKSHLFRARKQLRAALDERIGVPA